MADPKIIVPPNPVSLFKGEQLMPVVPFPEPMHTVIFKRLHESVPIPSRATDGSAAFDLTAFDLTESGRANRIMLPPQMTSRPIRTGLCIKPPKGCLALICSRSGLASRGIIVANSPGIIDPDYTGELNIILFNGSYNSQAVTSGERIAQLLFVPFVSPQWIEGQLEATSRGASGLGSSGL